MNDLLLRLGALIALLAAFWAAGYFVGKQAGADEERRKQLRRGRTKIFSFNS